MDTAAWVERLRGMGFTNYEARVYLALLGEESLTVADVVRKSGVPQPKVYESARTLTERGFIERVLGNVQSFRAVEPTTAFREHRERTERELERQAKEMKELESALPKADRLTADAWGVRIVQGGANGRAARDELRRNVKEELIHLIRPPIWKGATPHTAILSEPPPFKLYRLVDTSLLDDPDHGAAFSFMAATEPFTRVVPAVPMKMSIFDRKVITFPLQDRSEGSVIIIPQPELADQWARWAIAQWEAAPRYGAKQKPKRKKKPTSRRKS